RTGGEVLEQPVDLAPKILERTPRLHLRRGQGRFGFVFSRDRNLCLSFCHGILHPWLLFSLLKDTPRRASCIDAPQTLRRRSAHGSACGKATWVLQIVKVSLLRKEVTPPLAGGGVGLPLIGL